MSHRIFSLIDLQFYYNILNFLIKHEIKTSALNIKERSGNNSLHPDSENLWSTSNVGQMHHNLSMLSPLHEVQGTSSHSDM